MITVNEKDYPWIAAIPDIWGGVKLNIKHELDEVLNLPGTWGRFRLWGAGLQEDTFEPIRGDRFIDIERKYRLLDRYARWPEVVNSANGKYPFVYHDNGTDKAIGLDHFVQVLKLRYSQSMCVFALYQRLADEGFIEPDNIRRVFDLGSGGWSYAFVLSIVFPNLQTAVGADKGGEWEPFEKLWRPVFGLSDEQFVLCDKNFFELEKPSLKKTLEENFAIHGKADLAQIFMFKPEGLDQSYHKLFYQVGERLNPAGVLLVHVKGEDEYVVNHMRQCLKDIEHTELMDWHTDVSASGVIGPDEARVFVVKQVELIKLKGVMEKRAALIVNASQNPWDAISSYQHLLELDKDNPAYLLQQAKAYLSILPGDLRLQGKGAPLYHVSNSSHSITSFFENMMRAIEFDEQEIYPAEIDEFRADFFCKISVGSLAKTQPVLKTAWSPGEKRKYSNRLLKPSGEKKAYDEICADIFGLTPQDLCLSAIGTEFESVYQDYKNKKEDAGFSNGQESPGEYLVKRLFWVISSMTQEAIRARCSGNPQVF